MSEYTKEQLDEILEKHNLWLNNEDGGIMADLRMADLRGANLSEANLCGADLRDANLRNADLCGANLSKADLIGANLSYTNLSKADLSGSDLHGANLSGANLSGANLSCVNLSGAILNYANLIGADLYVANLSKADLSGTDLTITNLSRANLSETKGLVSVIDFLKENFEQTEDGYIAYKTFGSVYGPPESWDIESGSVIKETVNFDRCTGCASGINVAPLKWVHENCSQKPIWKVLIRWEWLCGVCVPYMTDGKIRCERVELLGVVE